MAKSSKQSRRKKPTPKYIQRPGETDKHFLNRINLDCQNIIKEKHFEDKYKVTIKRNPKTGKVRQIANCLKILKLSFCRLKM